MKVREEVCKGHTHYSLVLAGLQRSYSLQPCVSRSTKVTLDHYSLVLAGLRRSYLLQSCVSRFTKVMLTIVLCQQVCKGHTHYSLVLGGRHRSYSLQSRVSRSTKVILQSRVSRSTLVILTSLVLVGLQRSYSLQSCVSKSAKVILTIVLYQHGAVRFSVSRLVDKFWNPLSLITRDCDQNQSSFLNY